MDHWPVRNVDEMRRRLIDLNIYHNVQNGRIPAFLFGKLMYKTYNPSKFRSDTTSVRNSEPPSSKRNDGKSISLKWR